MSDTTIIETQRTTVVEAAFVEHGTEKITLSVMPWHKHKTVSVELTPDAAETLARDLLRRAKLIRK